MTFLEAAKIVLAEAEEPLSATEITRRALEKRLIESTGATPEATMRRELGTSVKRLGAAAEVVRVKRGLWALRESPAVGKARHWLFVTNPRVYDIEDAFRKDKETWGNVVAGNVAQKRLREEVRPGDTALVYRTQPHGDIYCELAVVEGPYHKRGRHLVDVKPTRRFDPPLSLQAVRDLPQLAEMEFLRNPRVSVSPLTDSEYGAICSVAEERRHPPPQYSHELVQWQLIALGKACGCDVWIAPDSRNARWGDERFADYCLSKWPDVGLSEETVRLIQGIDVLWIEEKSIVAAFEVEHSTSIYSGLLRLSDLNALQPNLNINLYIVASSSRRSSVVRQLNRPTFTRRRVPLTEACQFIPHEALSDLSSTASQLRKLGGVLQVDVIGRIAEDCLIQAGDD